MDVALDTLPDALPVFAISGALLLPGGRLPLTVVEPRYLALTDDALGAGRLFGLIQPRELDDAPDTGAVPGLYDCGILARIVAFGETADRRYLITAQGLIRFRIAAETDCRHGYRRVVPDYRPFAADLEPDRTFIDRHRMVNAVSTYMARRGLSADLGRLDGATDAELVTALAMAAPLNPEEKQDLLEAATTSARARLMTAMFEMALLTEDDGNMPLH